MASEESNVQLEPQVSEQAVQNGTRCAKSPQNGKLGSVESSNGKASSKSASSKSSPVSNLKQTASLLAPMQLVDLHRLPPRDNKPSLPQIQPNYDCNSGTILFEAEASRLIQQAPIFINQARDESTAIAWFQQQQQQHHHHYAMMQPATSQQQMAIQRTLNTSSLGNGQHQLTHSLISQVPQIGPSSKSELQLYQLLEVANLLPYYTTFINFGGDDVRQLLEADEEEFMEIMNLVGMTRKPLHIRRLQKALVEWRARLSSDHNPRPL